MSVEAIVGWGLFLMVIAGIAFYCYQDMLKHTQEQERQEEEETNFLNKYRQISADEIVLLKEMSPYAKTLLLTKVHGYSYQEAIHLMDTAVKEEQRARLKGVKRKISQRAMEQYADVPIHDRQPIPDDVKTFVWQRDRGKCVKCGGNEKLEFDHIIPFSKGGSNTGRNLQLLCEKCNREKSNNI